MADTTRKQTQKLTPEQIARQVEINARLETVHQAIREGRAYLDTAWGRHKVVGYKTTILGGAPPTTPEASTISALS